MCVISIEVLSAVTMKWEDYNMLCEIDCFCFFFIIRLWPYQFTYISPSNNSGEIISFQIMDSTTCKINAIIIWIKTFTQHKSIKAEWNFQYSCLYYDLFFFIMAITAWPLGWDQCIVSVLILQRWRYLVLEISTLWRHLPLYTKKRMEY